MVITQKWTPDAVSDPVTVDQWLEYINSVKTCTLKIQTWEPDTHSVRLTMLWDSVDQTFLKPISVESRNINGEWQQESNPEEKYAVVVQENQLKNAALQTITDAIPLSYKKQQLDEDGDPVIDSNGSPVYMLKSKYDPVWILGEVDGRISFNIPGATTEVCNIVRAALQPMYGDRVILTES